MRRGRLVATRRIRGLGGLRRRRGELSRLDPRLLRRRLRRRPRRALLLLRHGAPRRVRGWRRAQPASAETRAVFGVLKSPLRRFAAAERQSRAETDLRGKKSASPVGASATTPFAPRFIGRKMSGDEAPPRSPTPERADAPEGDRKDPSPDRGRDRSRSPPPRGRDSRSRSRSRDPPRADDRGRSPGAYGGGGAGRKVGIAGRWNSRGFGACIDFFASPSRDGPSLPDDDARIRRLIDRIGAPFSRSAFRPLRTRAREGGDGDRNARASAGHAGPRARPRREPGL